MIYVIIAITFFGFIGLAFVLLFPVHRFLTREEKLSEDWTPPERERSLSPRLTSDEKAAHAEFVAEMGDAALWARR